MAVHLESMNTLNDEEALLVQTVRAFVDRDVRPTVRDVEHANKYPEAWIEQMKRIGIYGLAVPEEYGGTPGAANWHSMTAGFRHPASWAATQARAPLRCSNGLRQHPFQWHPVLSPSQLPPSR